MTKQEYIKVCEKHLEEPAKSKMIEQINLFFDLSNKILKNEIYDVGENVVLKKDTFLHGFGNSKSLFDKYATEGLISKDFELGKIDKKISYCVSLWHIHKKDCVGGNMKTILITGASRGIGRATAIKFLENGWRVDRERTNNKPSL